VAKAVYPAKFIAVWLVLKPRDAGVVPVAKLPSEMVSAQANEADAARMEASTASLPRFFMNNPLGAAARKRGLGESLN